MTPGKMLDLITNYCSSNVIEERVFGNHLAAMVNGVPDEEILGTARDVTDRFNEALSDFCKDWLAINGE